MSPGDAINHIFRAMRRVTGIPRTHDATSSSSSASKPHHRHRLNRSCPAFLTACLIRRMAINQLRQETRTGLSLPHKRLWAAWDQDYRLKVLGMNI